MTALDALIGQARLASCDVATRDRYVACRCTDGRHALGDRYRDEVWDPDHPASQPDGYRLVSVWRDTHEEAVRDGLYLSGPAHVVLSLRAVITAPDEEVPA